VAVDLRARLVEQLARGGGLRLHVGELELDRLELVDGLPELLALARVGGRVVGGALGDADGLSGDAEARVVERAQRDGEALALGADEVLGGHADVLEHRLAGR
jgi:hypothetical protein